MSCKLPLPTVVALDLEGTLISNAVSQIPRPGLYDFLEACDAMFSRIVVFTTVRETLFRKVARLLVEEGLAPEWFADVEYVDWSGDKKDLRFIENVEPAEVLLVDDFERYVHPEQLAQWVKAAYFGHPYSSDDAELRHLTRVLKEKVQKAKYSA